MSLAPSVSNEVDQVVESLTRQVNAEPTALRRAVVAHMALTLWTDAGYPLSLLRNAMIRQAIMDSYSFTDLASALNLSRQRVQQLAEMPPGTPGRRPASQDRSAEVASVQVQRAGFTLEFRGKVEYQDGGETAVTHLDDGGTLIWKRLDGGNVVLDEGEAFRMQVEYRPGGTE
jgi:hypothetical protein